MLANSFETPDELTWVFDVRTDPVWHTGRPFDVDDVHYMFESIRDETVAGGGAPVSRMTVNFGLGEAVDASTYRLGLTKPTGYIETLLEQANLVDRETYEDRDETSEIIGTGPYTFTNYDPNRGWDQLPHADFASTNNHPIYSGGQPQFDKIQHTIFADTAAMGLAIEAGEVDSHQGVPLVVPEVEARLLDDENFTGYTGWGVGGRVLRFRADLEPFRNKLARQAVMMLVDGDRVRRDFGGTYDIAGRLPWQPGSAAFVPELDPHPLSGDQDAVRAEAGRLFDAAGFTGGETFKIDTINERVDAPALAQLLQQELSAFNIETEINPREYTEAVTLLTSGTFEHFFLGAGAWIRPGSPAYTILFSDEYTGRFSAPFDENVPLAERPGISDEPEWLDMIQGGIDGTWTDWQAWNEKLLDVAWGYALWRSYGVNFESKSVVQDLTRDANSWPYAPGTHFAT
ncbi:MAG: ABC-type transport system, substrate-binding protein [Chloroflexi bacterium]|nr:MAG: ABC-type transport system, substrate-binding protein [Chloroflexota bacterium]